MITKNASNRNAIIGYLDSVDEDTFIQDVIIPLFNQSGYLTLRINPHGPGEHGKDIVFFRHIPAFFDNEYVVVQAKAVKINTDNVTEIAYQIIRALRTPIVGIAGGLVVYPNYVILVNSRKVTNDAHFEFPYLVDGKNNIKVVAQENVCEMMMEASIVPGALEGVLIEQKGALSEDPNDVVRHVLYRNDPKEIQNLFDNVLFLTKDQLNDDVKGMAVEYIFNLWQQDPSWDGTVLPMKWLDKYFEFLRPAQFPYLRIVLDEYISSTPSFAAQGYTNSIVSKIEAKHILAFKDQYIYRMLQANQTSPKAILLMDKFIDLQGEPGLTTEDRDLIVMLKSFIRLLRKSQPSEEEQRQRREIYEALARKLYALRDIVRY
ncbi:MAG: hypothetical protein ABSG74_14190 [Candidatus Bathyarchaeia archaeon]